MFRRLLFAALSLSLVATGIGAQSELDGTCLTRPEQSPLEFSLSANLAPQQVTARVHVEPDAHWQTLTIEWRRQNGSGGSHLVMLAGENSTAQQDFVIKRLEAGAYVVSAALVRDDGSVIQKRSTITVSPSPAAGR